MRSVYTEEIATDKVYPHIAVYRTFRDGVQNGWRLITDPGYVMYDSNDHYTEVDPDTMEETPVTYYYTRAELTLNYNFDAFPWVAVSRDSVDENYIFGAGDDNHKTM